MTNPDDRPDGDQLEEHRSQLAESDPDDVAAEPEESGEHAPLTTDPKTQVDDSVIEPASA